MKQQHTRIIPMPTAPILEPYHLKNLTLVTIGVRTGMVYASTTLPDGSMLTHAEIIPCDSRTDPGAWRGHVRALGSKAYADLTAEHPDVSFAAVFDTSYPAPATPIAEPHTL